MLLLDDEALRDRLPYGALVQALHAMFTSDCVVPPRHVHAIGDGQGGSAGHVLIMPAWREGRRLGIKTVNVFPGNAARGLSALHGVYTLFDAATGVPLAQLDGTELTTRRTVAASALAASFLARPDSRRLLIVGAGRLASCIAEALRSVLPGLAEVRIWARRPEAASALATALAARGFDAAAVNVLEHAVTEADIVSCSTMSATPLVHARWLRPGAHVDLMGGFTPTMREADGEAIARSRVFVDTEEALAKAGDLLQAAAEGHFDAATALRGTLAQLCRGERPGRGDAAEITLFKSVGTALEDLAAAELAVDGAPECPPKGPMKGPTIGRP